jgi:hypothetical protein
MATIFTTHVIIIMAILSVFVKPEQGRDGAVVAARSLAQSTDNKQHVPGGSRYSRPGG